MWGGQNFRDLTGQTFNMLTVKGEAYRENGGVFWNVKCECGTEKVVSGSNLDKTKSCGCMNHKSPTGKNKTGQRIGMLLVKEKLANEILASNHQYSRYLCICDCGKEKTIMGDALGSGNTLSCGCAKRFLFSLNKLWFVIKDYKNNAANRKIAFELSDAQVEELVKRDCHYCGFSLSGVRSDLQQFAFNGIDRLDNSKGYQMENVVPCCKVCNHAKKGMTESDFISWILKVADFQRKGLQYPN
jgi:hypothetical protein